MCHHLRGDGLHHLADAVNGGRDLLVLVGYLAALDKFGDEAAVGGDDQFTHVGKLCARLGDDDLSPIGIRGLGILKDIMRMAVEHDVNPPDGVHQLVGVEAHRLGGLPHVGEQHHVVGSLGPCIIDSLLDQVVESLRLQVVEQDTVGIIERITLKDHRLRRTGPDVGYTFVAILPDDVGRIDGLWLTGLEQVGTDHGGTYLRQQFLHTGHAIVELVIAYRQGVIVHVAHDVGDILSLGDGTRGVALQEVSTTDGCRIGRVRTIDRIAQPSHLRIAVDAAMHVVLIEDHDALLSLNCQPARHEGHHT